MTQSRRSRTGGTAERSYVQQETEGEGDEKEEEAGRERGGGEDESGFDFLGKSQSLLQYIKFL